MYFSVIFVSSAIISFVIVSLVLDFVLNRFDAPFDLLDFIHDKIKDKLPNRLGHLLAKGSVVTAIIIPIFLLVSFLIVLSGTLLLTGFQQTLISLDSPKLESVKLSFANELEELSCLDKEPVDKEACARRFEDNANIIKIYLSDKDAGLAPSDAQLAVIEKLNKELAEE
jgi:hypothetical protein